jgi:hypothetical protein
VCAARAPKVREAATWAMPSARWLEEALFRPGGGVPLSPRTFCGSTPQGPECARVFLLEDAGRSH